MASDLPNKLWFAYLVALVVWGLLAYVELGKYQMRGELFAHNQNDRPYISDFVNMYSAATLARRCVQGEKVPVYDIQVQEASVKELTKPVVAELPFYFQYPPYTFALALPLSLVPILYAWLCWNVLGLGLSAWALWAVAKDTFKTPFTRTFAMVGVFSSMPAWVSVWLGQPSLFACAGVTGFFLCLWRKRPYLAAVCTIPVLVKMQYLPVIGLIGAITLGVPYVLTVGALLGALLVLAVAVLGIDNVSAFPHALSQETASAVSGVAAEVMQNLRGFLTLVLPQSPDVVRVVCLIAYAAGTIAIAYMWYSMKRKGTLKTFDGVAFAASMTTLVMLMTSVHTHRQDYLLTAAPCIWLYMLAKKFSDRKGTRAVRILIVSFPFASWLYFILHPLLVMIYIQPFFFWALTLAAISFLSLRSHVGASTESEENQSQTEPS